MTTDTPDGPQRAPADDALRAPAGDADSGLAVGALVPWLSLVAIGVAWGATGPISKFVMIGDVDPIGVSFLGTLIGTVLLIGWLRARGLRLPMTRRHLVFFAVCGFVGTALPHTLGYAAIRHLPIGVIAIVISAVPIMTFLMALPMGLDRPDPRRLLGLVCGLAAVLFLIVPEASLPDAQDALWLVLPIVTALAYAFEGLYISRVHPPDCGPMQTMCGFFIAAAAMQAPVVLATGAWMSPGALPLATAALGVLTCLHIGAYAGYVWLIGRAGPVFSAQVGYVVTLTGVVTGILFWDETHSTWVWGSLGLMMVGLTLVKPRRA